jgi:hypothetical protein
MADQTEDSGVQIKQEYLIYGVAAAVVVIVILVGALLYVISGSGATGQSNVPAGQPQLPAGHPPVQPGAVPGPLSPDQIPGGSSGANSQSATPQASPK